MGFVNAEMRCESDVVCDCGDASNNVVCDCRDVQDYHTVDMGRQVMRSVVVDRDAGVIQCITVGLLGGGGDAVCDCRMLI